MSPCGKAPTVEFVLQYAGFIIKFRTLSPEKLTRMSLKRPDLKCQIKRGIQFKDLKVHLETRPILHSKFHRYPLRSFCVILLKYQQMDTGVCCVKTEDVYPQEPVQNMYRKLQLCHLPRKLLKSSTMAATRLAL